MERIWKYGKNIERWKEDGKKCRDLKKMRKWNKDGKRERRKTRKSERWEEYGNKIEGWKQDGKMETR